MKFFRNKKIWKKLVLMLLIILLFQLVSPAVRAADDNDDGNFGIITGPIVSLIVALGDRH